MVAYKGSKETLKRGFSKYKTDFTHRDISKKFSISVCIAKKGTFQARVLAPEQNTCLPSREREKGTAKFLEVWTIPCMKGAYAKEKQSQTVW
jgi:hypothetical protein